MSLGIEFSRKLALAYNAVCKPLCRELGLSKTAFDILMFLGNNPAYKTARDVVELRCLKANLVSVNVDRLVQEGYLIRRLGLMTAAALIPAKPVPRPAPIPAKNVTRIVTNICMGYSSASKIAFRFLSMISMAAKKACRAPSSISANSRWKKAL